MRLLFLIIVALFLEPVFAVPPPYGHEIRVKINGFDRSEVFLAYQMGGKTYVQDTGYKSNDGYFVFSGNEELPAGIYLVVMPPENKYFELLIDKKNQRFSCETSQVTPIESMKVKGSTDNTLFYEYNNYLIPKVKKLKSLQAMIEEGQPENALAEKQLKQLREEIRKYTDNLIATHAGTVFSLFLRSTQPAEANMPDFEGDEMEVNKRRLAWARTRWFDHMSLSNAFFVRTAMFSERVNKYLDNMTVQHPDSLVVAVEYLLTQSKSSNEVFKYLVVELVNRFAASAVMGMDQVYVHIVDKYYRSGIASWVDGDQRKKMIDNSDALKHILIGKKAPLLRLETVDGLEFNLNNYKSDYTLLFFWQPASGKALRELKQLKNIADDLRTKGLRVVTICTPTESVSKDTWIAELEKQQIGSFLNTYDANPAESGTRMYNLRTSPVIFLLDNQKVIRYKNIAVSQVEGVMKQMLKERE